MRALLLLLKKALHFYTWSEATNNPQRNKLYKLRNFNTGANSFVCWLLYYVFFSEFLECFWMPLHYILRAAHNHPLALRLRRLYLTSLTLKQVPVRQPGTQKKAPGRRPGQPWLNYSPAGFLQEQRKNYHLLRHLTYCNLWKNMRSTSDIFHCRCKILINIQTIMERNYV
jgi:hypothetical protein